MNPSLTVPPPTERGSYILYPGDVVCGRRGDRLQTLLGSCVAVVLSDPARTVGAMCHIVVSGPTVHRSSKPTAGADAAIDAMYRLLKGHGMVPRLCEAFVYGGGNMFPSIFKESSVGDTNARRVLDRLYMDGIRVLAQDVGGNAYRRLVWTIGDDPPDTVAVGVSGPRPTS